MRERRDLKTSRLARSRHGRRQRAAEIGRTPWTVPHSIGWFVISAKKPRVAACSGPPSPPPSPGSARHRSSTLTTPRRSRARRSATRRVATLRRSARRSATRTRPLHPVGSRLGRCANPPASAPRRTPCDIPVNDSGGDKRCCAPSGALCGLKNPDNGDDTSPVLLPQPYLHQLEQLCEANPASQRLSLGVGHGFRVKACLVGGSHWFPPLPVQPCVSRARFPAWSFQCSLPLSPVRRVTPKHVRQPSRGLVRSLHRLLLEGCRLRPR